MNIARNQNAPELRVARHDVNFKKLLPERPANAPGCPAGRGEENMRAALRNASTGHGWSGWP
jgi:hypothetical protein